MAIMEHDKKKQISKTTLQNIDRHMQTIKYCINDFDISIENYIELKPFDLGISGDVSNSIYIKDRNSLNNIQIIFSEKSKNCKVFLGENIKCKKTRFTFKNEDGLLFIGKGTSLTNVSSAIQSKNDFILVGEGVSVTSNNNWNTGTNPSQNNSIIIGDHCLMASEIVLRPADGHPIIDLTSRKQINEAHAPIIIEPYCWIGQRAAILKNVRIGACSIISFNAVVTKSCEKFSVMAGVPAKSRSIEGKMWLRNNGAEAKRLQAFYEDRFSQRITEIILTDDAEINE